MFLHISTFENILATHVTYKSLKTAKTSHYCRDIELKINLAKEVCNGIVMSV